MPVLNPDNLRIPTEPGATPCLLGSRCRDCGNVVFPKMPVCPACGHNDTMDEVEIGFKAPFFQVFVDLPEGPRIFSLVGDACPVEQGAIEDGMEMRLVIEPVADTPERREQLTYKYVPARNGGSR